MKTPHVRTELPGPKARAILERDAPVSSPSYPRDYPFVISHGRGVEVWDVDGNRFLDFAAGIAVCATGHAHPQVVKAIKDAADKFLHISSDYWHEGFVRLAERLAELAPMGEPVMTFLAQSGTESVEGRAEARALRHGAAPVHRLPRRLPRPHHGLARLHVEQVHPAAGLLPHHARRHPRALPEPLSTPLRRGRPGTGRPRLHRARALPGQRAAERGRRDPRRAHPGRGRLPRAPGRLPAGPARPLRPPRDPADLRRGAGGRGPHREDVRRPALERRSRHHDPRQGPRLRAPHRRGGGEEAAHGEVVPRGPRQHVRGQSPLLRRRPRDARPRGARVRRQRGDRGRALHGPTPGAPGAARRHRRRAGQGPDDRHGAGEGPRLAHPAKELCDAVIHRAFHNGLILLSCGTSTVRFMPPLLVTKGEVDEAVTLLEASLVEAKEGAR